MMKRFILCLGILALLVPSVAVLAQPGIDDVEGLIDAAVTQLGEQLGVALRRVDLTQWRWEELYFSDSALNCPLPDESPRHASTRGYLILLDYQQRRYEFHLAPDGSEVRFCGQEVFSLPTATPSPTPVDATPEATQPAPTSAFTDRQTGFDTILTYVNDQTRLGLTRGQITRWTVQTALFDDESLDCPQPNRTYDSYPFPVPGFEFTFLHGSAEYEIHMTWEGSRIMPCGDTPLLPYMDRTRDPIGPASATPAPTATPAVAG